MNPRLLNMRQRIRDGAHRSIRQAVPISIVEECDAENLSWMRRAARLTVRQCEAEKVVIEPDERIVFTRTLPAQIPPYYSEADWAHLTAGHKLHELGPISNVCADWGKTLAQGLQGRKHVAQQLLARSDENSEAGEFARCAIETIDAVLGLAVRYAHAARAMNRVDVADILDHVPANTPRTFHEALQALRLIHAVVWLSGHYHVGLGRFDQYMWPYLKADLDTGRLDQSQAADLLAEFFIALNKDSDLYPGVQQGDNGQSMTLGGVDRDGQPAVNALTHMVLHVSRELAMIDPKINLRISAHTDLDLLSLATELTRKGLGFPQYSNDDVVIPALVAHDYRLEDARDYAVAACWEFLVPGRGMEIVNIGAVSFPAAVDQAIRAGLPAGDDFAGLLKRVRESIYSQVSTLVGIYETLLLPPAPYYACLMTECLEQGRDLCKGARYNNFGIHGAGAANAADALAAVQCAVYAEGRVLPADLLYALDEDYQGFEELRLKLIEDCPRVGNDDQRADSLMVQLFEMLADACCDYGRTSRDGVLRPGTGSAMYYVWLTQGHAGMNEPVVGATAEGRHKGHPLGANLAPSQESAVCGPFSVLLSFAKLDYGRIFNGGPITMELSDSVFRDEESVRKVAMLVRTFAQLGDQQLQLNTLNVEKLRDAQLHPEIHKDLIVRVWGWSGYFCELGPEYQEQIIARHMHGTP